MKTRCGDQVYEVLRFQDCTWVWCDYEDSRDLGEVALPQEVYDRLAREITGMFAVREQVYWIRLGGPLSPSSHEIHDSSHCYNATMAGRSAL